MYHINTETDKPNAERLKKNVEEMARRGIKVGDISLLMNRAEELVNDIKQTIREQYGIENPNSVKQIAEYLSELSDSTETGEKDYVLECCYNNGKWVTNEAALSELYSYGFEIGNDIITYRKAKKNYDTVCELFKYSDANGFIHPEVSLTKTNRISYKKPALMNIGKNILNYVIVPPEEGKIYSVDIKNQEPGILINMLDDETLTEALRSTEGLYNNLFKKVYRPTVKMNFLFDTFFENRIYKLSELKNMRFISPKSYMPEKAKCKSWFLDGKRIVAVETICQGTEKGKEAEREFPDKVIIETEDGEVYDTKVVWENIPNKASKDYSVTGYLPEVEINLQPNERKQFKTAFLAINYGASNLGIENICTSIDGNLMYSTVTKYDRMKKYRDMVSKCAKMGVTTLKTAFGTDVSTDKTGDQKELKRSLLSLPIQGTGADILDLLVERYKTEAKKKFGEKTNYVYYTRHDELRIFFGKEIIEQYKKEELEDWLKDTLEHQLDDWVPFQVEVEEIKNGDTMELVR